MPTSCGSLTHQSFDFDYEKHEHWNGLTSAGERKYFTGIEIRSAETTFHLLLIGANSTHTHTQTIDCQWIKWSHQLDNHIQSKAGNWFMIEMLYSACRLYCKWFRCRCMFCNDLLFNFLLYWLDGQIGFWICELIYFCSVWHSKEFFFCRTMLFCYFEIYYLFCLNIIRNGSFWRNFENVVDNNGGEGKEPAAATTVCCLIVAQAVIFRLRWGTLIDLKHDQLIIIIAYIDLLHVRQRLRESFIAGNISLIIIQ